MCENKSVYTHIVPIKPLKGLRLLNNMITILANSVAEECACMSSIDQDSNGLWERIEARLNWVNVYNALTLMIKLKKSGLQFVRENAWEIVVIPKMLFLLCPSLQFV